jgi:hypothetical protein
VQQTKRGAPEGAPLFHVADRYGLLLERILHFADGLLAAFFLRRTGELEAAGGRELANERQITALKLTRRELLGRQRGLAGTGLAAALRGLLLPFP